MHKRSTIEQSNEMAKWALLIGWLVVFSVQSQIIGSVQCSTDLGTGVLTCSTYPQCLQPSYSLAFPRCVPCWSSFFLQQSVYQQCGVTDHELDNDPLPFLMKNKASWEVRLHYSEAILYLISLGVDTDDLFCRVRQACSYRIIPIVLLLLINDTLVNLV